MAIFSNPLFATYSVYARNASIVKLHLYASPYHYNISFPWGWVVQSSIHSLPALLSICIPCYSAHLLPWICH